ncbi:MAG: phosphoribosyltransferase family protein [Nonlabens sp.]
MATQILDHNEILHKNRRIAYQIAEVFSEESDIILAGISGQGYLFAEMLAETLVDICSLDVTLCKVEIDKKSPLEPISTSLELENISNGNVVLCDDVLNSGTTLIYAIRHLLQVPLKKFKTAVLVNRNHKKYPVKADFKGISLSTTLENHIKVNLREEPYTALLE